MAVMKRPRGDGTGTQVLLLNTGELSEALYNRCLTTTVPAEQAMQPLTCRATPVQGELRSFLHPGLHPPAQGPLLPGAFGVAGGRRRHGLCPRVLLHNLQDLLPGDRQPGRFVHGASLLGPMPARRQRLTPGCVAIADDGGV